MIKKYLGLTLICLVLLTAFTTVPPQEQKANSVSVKRFSEGYTLSINATNLPLEKLLEKLINKYPLRVITYREGIIFQPITIKFKDVPLEQGIKLLLKECGIKNYFIQYRHDEKNRAYIAALTLLGNGTKAVGKTITEGAIKTKEEKESITSFVESLSSDNEFAEKIAALKKRYEWADGETEELAGYLLGLMPEPARGPGMEALMNELDWRVPAGGNDAVDEEIFFQALENTVPSHLVPVMMDSIKQYSQCYKAGTLHETDEQPPNELYQEVMTKRLSNRNNDLKGGSSYDDEDH